MGRQDFFVAPANAAALAGIDAWAGWPQGKLLLVGPAGSGKTHLARLWAAETGAVVLAGAAVAAADLPALAGAGLVAVDNAAAVAGDPAAERALLHLHNMLAEAGGRLLLTARRPAPAWGLALADLASRVEAAALVRLEAPDDALLAAVLVKLFADRQLAVGPDLVAYLVARMERSLGAARAIVAALDRGALAAGRAVTVARARALLAGREGGGTPLPPPAR